MRRTLTRSFGPWAGANLAGGLFQAFPAGGGLSQTAVNDASGARSPLAGAVTAVGAALTMLFLTGPLENLADATLGAVVLVAVLGLLDTTAIRGISRVRSRDATLALVTVVGVLLFGVLDGVLVAVVVSILSLMYGLNRMPVRRLGRARHDRANRRREASRRAAVPDPARGHRQVRRCRRKPVVRPHLTRNV